MKTSMLIVMPLAWVLSGAGAMVDASLHSGYHSSKAAHGWLYPSGTTRIVRFASETRVEGHPQIYVPFQASGFIFLLDDTFSISVSRPDDVILLKYRGGLLSRTSTDLSAVQSPKRLSLRIPTNSAIDSKVIRPPIPR